MGTGTEFNKTGLQPVSKPVEQILSFFPKGLKKGTFSKSLKMVCGAYLGVRKIIITYTLHYLAQ